MATYAPAPIDLYDVASLLGGANPARDNFYAGIARRRPELLSGFAGAQDQKLNQLVDRSYAQTDDVNAMLNELAQGELFNEGRKNEVDLFKQIIQGQSSDGYRRGIGPVVGAAGYPDLGGILGESNAIGDEFNLDETNASAYNKRKSADAAMVNAQANQQRAADAGKFKTRMMIDPYTKLPTLTYEMPGTQGLADFGNMGVEFAQPGGAGVPPGTVDLEPSMGGAQPQRSVINEREQLFSKNGKRYKIVTYSDGSEDVFDAETGQPVTDE